MDEKRTDGHNLGLLSIVIAVSITLNGFFLSHTYIRLERLEQQLQKLEIQLARDEASLTLSILGF